MSGTFPFPRRTAKASLSADELAVDPIIGDDACVTLGEDAEFIAV
jgi:hypothetical protein